MKDDDNTAAIKAMGKHMTKDKVIESLKLAQDALHMATLPFPIDEVKTLKALQAVDDVLDAMPLFNDWDGGFK